MYKLNHKMFGRYEWAPRSFWLDCASGWLSYALPKDAARVAQTHRWQVDGAELWASTRRARLRTSKLVQYVPSTASQPSRPTSRSPVPRQSVSVWSSSPAKCALY